MPIKPKSYSFSTIILAAGISKRMHSKTPKILYKILGKPIISFVVDTAKSLNSKEIIVVVGKNFNEVRKILGNDLKFAIQEIPRGSGDAVKKGLAFATSSYILTLYGDVPLLKKETIQMMIDDYFKNNADFSVLTCEISDPKGYGRIIRNKYRKIIKIVEDVDARPEELKIKEINTGIYFGSKDLISNALSRINPDNRQNEFYFTDVVYKLIEKEKKVIGYKINDEHEIQGINTKLELAQVREIVKKDWFRELMLKGVYIEDPNTTTIDLTVKIGNFVHIRPFTIIEGNTVIKDNEVVGPFVWIKDGKKKRFYYGFKNLR